MVRTTEMIPMEYGNGLQKSKLLYKEVHEINGQEYKIVIINIRGSHPCAYVQFPEIDKVPDYDNVSTNNGCPHGGFTFLGELEETQDFDDPDLKGLWLGWDYAHLGDASWGRDGTQYKTWDLADYARSVLLDFIEGEYEIYTDD